MIAELERHTRCLSCATGPLELTAAQISPTITTITSTLSYSWYITTALSGPYDTDQMAFVARKAVMAPHFPLSNWEFYGPTSLVKVEGFVMVDSPGNYSIAAASDDKFIVWLDDKWLQMQQIGDAGAAVGLPAAAWVAGVHFRDAGATVRLHQFYWNGLKWFRLSSVMASMTGGLCPLGCTCVVCDSPNRELATYQTS